MCGYLSGLWTTLFSGDTRNCQHDVDDKVVCRYLGHEPPKNISHCQITDCDLIYCVCVCVCVCVYLFVCTCVYIVLIITTLIVYLFPVTSFMRERERESLKDKRCSTPSSSFLWDKYLLPVLIHALLQSVYFSLSHSAMLMIVVEPVYTGKLTRYSSHSLYLR